MSSRPVTARHGIPLPKQGWGDKDEWQTLIREIKELATNANFARRDSDWDEVEDCLAAIRDLLIPASQETVA